MRRQPREPGWIGAMSSDHVSPCCGPQRSAGAGPTMEELPTAEHRRGREFCGHSGPEVVALEGRRFLMGTNDPDGFPGDGEGPVREVELSAFAIERLAVSNRRFA